MNDRDLEQELYREGWAKGLRSRDLTDYIRERWTPEAAVDGPDESTEEETPEEETPEEEPKPKTTKKKKAKKKTTKKKAGK